MASRTARTPALVAAAALAGCLAATTAAHAVTGSVSPNGGKTSNVTGSAQPNGGKTSNIHGSAQPNGG